MNKTAAEESQKSASVRPFFWGRGPIYRAGGTNICTARDQFCCICRHHTPGGPCTSPWRPLQPPVRKTGIVAATFLGCPCPFFGQRQGLLRAKVAVVAFVAFPPALCRCSCAVGHMYCNRERRSIVCVRDTTTCSHTSVDFLHKHSSAHDGAQRLHFASAPTSSDCPSRFSFKHK